MSEIALKEQKEKINSLIQAKYGDNIRLTGEELFLLNGFINEKGLSIYSNDFYIIQYYDKKINAKKNQIITSIEGIRKCARKMGKYSLRFEYINQDYEISKYPNSKEPFIIKAILSYNGETLERDIVFSEYTTQKNLWISKPFTMLQKVAEATILRVAFNLGGMYVAEEMSAIENTEPKEVYEEKIDSNIPIEAQKQEARRQPSEVQKRKQEVFYTIKNNLGITDKDFITRFIEKAKQELNIAHFDSVENLDKLSEYVQSELDKMEQKAESSNIAQDFFDDDEPYADGMFGGETDGEYGND